MAGSLPLARPRTRQPNQNPSQRYAPQLQAAPNCGVPQRVGLAGRPLSSASSRHARPCEYCVCPHRTGTLRTPSDDRASTSMPERWRSVAHKAWQTLHVVLYAAEQTHACTVGNRLAQHHSNKALLSLTMQLVLKTPTSSPSGGTEAANAVFPLLMRSLPIAKALI